LSIELASQILFDFEACLAWGALALDERFSTV